VILHTDSLTLHVLDYDPVNRWRFGRPINVDRMPTSVHLEDLNADGLVDMLIYDEQEPGILPVYQTRRGGWRTGRTIIPDLPVGEVATLHLNNDGLLDLLAYDWVRSEIHLVYGIGNERYLDQGGFQVEGSVTRIFVDPVTPHHPLRVTFFDKLRSTLSYFEMVLGLLAGGVARGVIVCSSVYLVSLLFAPLTIMHPFILFFLMLTIAVIFSCGGMMGALWAEDFGMLGVWNIYVIVPLVLLGGVFHPMTMLPKIVQNISKFNPMYYLVNGIRYSITGVSDAPILLCTAISALLAVGFFFFTVHLFKIGYKLRT